MKLVLALTGTIACGKEFITTTLKEQGFSCFTLSDYVREEARKRGVPEDRKTLQDIGNEFREREGLAVWVSRALDDARASRVEKFVIDGVRNPGEVAFLKTHASALLIAVDAPIEMRFRRTVDRSRDGDPIRHAEFVAADSRDRGVGEDSAGQQVEQCLALADYSIWNTGSPEEVKTAVLKILDSQAH